MGNGIGDEVVAAYNWINQPLFDINLPFHLPHPVKAADNALDGAIDSAVRGILEATGLISILQEVTGKPEALAQAADVWLDQTPLLNRTCGEAVSVGESRTPPIVGRAGVNQT